MDASEKTWLSHTDSPSALTHNRGFTVADIHWYRRTTIVQLLSRVNKEHHRNVYKTKYEIVAHE